MSKKYYSVSLVLFLLVFNFTGCSSTGYSTQSDLVVPVTIRSPKEVHAELVQYLPTFVNLLQQKGFAVGETQDPRALGLVFEFNGNPFNLWVSASLWRDGVPILTAGATNSGWGTALARGSAVSSRVDSVLSKFESELASLMAHTKIVPDTTDTATQRVVAVPTDKQAEVSPVIERDKYGDLERLKDLLDDGAITQEEYDSEKAKILSN